MASNKRNKPAKPPPKRASTHPSKTSKKRSHSISTPSTPVAKKAKPKVAPQPSTRISPPLRPKVSLFTPSPPASAQPLININTKDNDEGEDNNKGEKEVEDDDAEEPPSPPAVVRFISVWKAFNKKEVLPRSRSAMLNQNILYLTAIKA